MCEKLKRLHEILKRHGKIAVALSGGADSSFLFAEAVRALGAPNVLGIHIVSPIGFPEETERVRRLADQLSARAVFVEFSELDELEGFSNNPPDRCYICKRARFELATSEAQARGFEVVADGTNADDSPHERPGMRAASELGIAHPLKEAGLTKRDIRALAKDAGYEFWNAAPQSCVMTRFPHGFKVEKELAERIKAAESEIRSLGFWLVRVRYDGNRATVEVAANELDAARNLKSEISGIIEDELNGDIMKICIRAYKPGG